MRLAPLMAALCVPLLCDAQTVYKYTDKSGTAVFSDTPVPGSEPIEVQRPIIIPTPPPRTQYATEPPKANGYQHLVITSPSDETIFRNRFDPVTVAWASDPALLPGHRYELLVNGQSLAGPSNSASASVPIPNRGTYQLTVRIVDGSLQPVLTSKPVAFHVLRPVVRSRTP